MNSIKTEPFATAIVLLLVLGMVGNGLALKCRNCVSSQSFEHCDLMGEISDCNATVVNANHAALVADNPTLVQGNGTEFKCYRIQVARLNASNADTGLRGYARGCTFLNTTFCNGWVSSLNVTSCGTCTTDNCDQNPVVPTDAPVTTTAGGVTSPGQITTTKKPSTGGASVLTQLSLTGLGCLSFLLLLAGR